MGWGLRQFFHLSSLAKFAFAKQYLFVVYYECRQLIDWRPSHVSILLRCGLSMQAGRCLDRTVML